MFRRINIVPEETARPREPYARALGEDEAAMEAAALKVLRRFPLERRRFPRHTLKTDQTFTPQISGDSVTASSCLGEDYFSG